MPVPAPSAAALRALPAWPPALDETVWAQQGWQDAEDVREACRRGTVRDLLQGDEAAQRALARALASVPSASPRRALARARRVAERVLEFLQDHPEALRLAVGGALRRMEPEIEVVDLLATSAAPDALLEEFAQARFVRAAGRGPTHVDAVLDDGSAVRLEVFPEDAHAFALAQLERTGPAAHVRALRDLARRRGWTWDTRLTREGREAPLEVEADVYALLDVPWTPPERRHAVAPGVAEPTLVAASDLRGLARLHSDAGAGRFPLATLADAATRQGFAWALVADRTFGPGPHLGAHDDGPRRAAAAWAAATPPADGDGTSPPRAEVLLGRLVEVGLPDPPAPVTGPAADLVIGVLHAPADAAPDAATIARRLVAAIQAGALDVLAHPAAARARGWGRTWDDWQPVVAALAAHGAAVEIAGSAGRLPLPAGWAEGVAAAGLPVLLAADEHQPGDLDAALAALGVARRQGWTRDRVLNTWTAARVRTWAATRRAP